LGGTSLTAAGPTNNRRRNARVPSNFINRVCVSSARMKKRKLSDLECLPPEYWDGLSTTFFTRNALRELDRRNAQRQEELKRAQKQQQRLNVARRSHRLCLDERAGERAAPTVDQVLAQLSPPCLKQLKKSATHGGPDLSDLRGYSVPRKSNDLHSLKRGKQKPPPPRLKFSETASTPTVGLYDDNFQQHLIDNGVYPHRFRYPEGHLPPLPANLEDIKQALCEPRLFERRISKHRFNDFSLTDAELVSKSEVMTHIVLPVLEGHAQENQAHVKRVSLINLDPLTDGTLFAASPDLCYGAYPEELARTMRQRLSSLIVPTLTMGLIAPNFFIETGYPRGSAAIAQRQLCHDMALGERGQIALLSVGKSRPVYDNCAHTLGYTYQCGALRLYAMHAIEPSTATSKPEYVMTQVDAYCLTGDLMTFDQGIRALRNGRDWAKRQRDHAIAKANDRGAWEHNLPPPTEDHDSVSSTWQPLLLLRCPLSLRLPPRAMDERPGPSHHYLLDKLPSIAALCVAFLCGIFPTNRTDILFIFLAFLYLEPSSGLYSLARLITSLLPASLIPIICYAFYSFSTPSSDGGDDPAWTGPGRPYLIPSRTTHRRLFPEKHSFSYSYLVVGVPVGFSGNIRGIVSACLPSWRRKAWFDVDAADYLQRGFSDVGLRGKLDGFLRSQNVDPLDYPHAYLVTAARFLGYHFNPVSFWYLYSADKVLSAMILEVNNTFGERRPYLVLRDFAAEESGSRIEASWPKDFHVSPFNSRKGTYSVLANDPLGAGMEGFRGLDVTIRLRSNKGHAKIVARLFSDGECVDPFTMSAMQRLAFVGSWFWVGFVTFPRIVREAAALYFARGLHVWYRPEPLKESLGRLADGVETDLERVFRRYLQFLLEKSSAGSLSVTYVPSGIVDVAAQVFTSAAEEEEDRTERVEIRVLTPVFYSRFVQYADELEAMLREMTESGTVWVDKPRLLRDLFPSEERSLPSFPRMSFTDSISFKLIRKLRRRPLAIPQPGLSSSVARRVRKGRFSALDVFVLMQDEELRRLYRAAVLRLKVLSTIGFQHGSKVMTYIWGPLRYLIQTTKSTDKALDNILNVYERLGNEIPPLYEYSRLFLELPESQWCLVYIYEAVLTFHRLAYKLFSTKAQSWHKLFTASWKASGPTFDYLVESLEGHRQIIETQGCFVRDPQASLEDDDFERLDLDVEMNWNDAKMEFYRHQNETRARQQDFEEKEVIKTEENKKKVMTWISASDKTYSLHKELQGMRICRDTGRWLFRRYSEVTDWIREVQPPEYALWLHGSKGFVDELNELCTEKKKLAIPKDSKTYYFYLQGEDPENCTYCDILKGILRQMVDAEMDLLPLCTEKAKADTADTETLQGLVEAFFEYNSRQYVVLDGLDECDVLQIRQTVKFFMAQAAKCNNDIKQGQLRILFMSQPMPVKITEGCMPEDDARVELKPVDNADDIRAYVRKRMAEFCEPRATSGGFNLSEGDMKQMENIICLRSEDMFLYAHLAIEYLLQQPTKERLLHKIQDEILPKKLSQIYEKLLGAIKTELLQLAEGETHWQMTRLLLGWLVCAKRPLKWHEMQSILSYDPVSQKVDFDNKMLRQNVRRYIVENEHINQMAVQCDLAIICLRYLCLPCFTADCDEDNHREMAKLGWFSFQDYACSKWFSHISTVMTACRDLFNDASQRLEYEPKLDSALKSFIDTHGADLTMELHPDLQLEHAELSSFSDLSFHENLCLLWNHIYTHQKEKYDVRNSIGLKQLGKALENSRETLEKNFTPNSGAYINDTIGDYYGTKLYKCKLPLCPFFYLGYDDKKDRDQHHSRHDRPYHCPEEKSCIFGSIGFRLKKDRDKHIRNYHSDLAEQPSVFEAISRRKESPSFSCNSHVRKNSQSDSSIESLTSVYHNQANPPLHASHLVNT
ncbi:hypothetical protein CP533_4893, partial [Ophiocordyceps camponoti-saundersi (nom. inval.)]